MNIPKCSSELNKGLQINEYELVALLCKRAVELMHGAKPLIDDKSNNPIEITIKELLSGKIKASTNI